jgi:hypothetical protein
MVVSLTREALRDIRTRLWLCIMVIMLSVDALNPIKLIGDVFTFPEETLALVAAAIFTSIVIANGKELTYYAIKIFFKSILNIFFSSIEVCAFLMFLLNYLDILKILNVTDWLTQAHPC